MLLLSSADFFQNYLKKKKIRNTIRVLNGLDPNQDRHSVGPDMGPSRLHRLSADDKRRCHIARKEISNHLSTT